MAISDIKFKATEQTPVENPAPASTPPASSAPTTAEALEMKKKIEAALHQIEEAEKYDQYFVVGEKAELEKSKALLMADYAALDHFLKSSEWLGPVLPESASSQNPMYFNLEDVGSGWFLYNASGELVAPEISADGSITVPNNSTQIDPATGKAVPTNLWFVMESNGDPAKDMVGIKGKNVGNDIMVTVTYADNHTQSYKIINGAIRSDIQVGVNALKSNHAVMIDFSETSIVDQKSGKKSGVFVIASKKSGDVVYGSAGKDEINLGGGDDFADGLGGNDDVYGYASAQVQQAYGPEALGEDGNDIIYDVYGTDNIFGGGGGADQVYRGETGGITAPAQEIESPEQEIATSPEDIKGWFDTEGWSVGAKGNELVLESDKSAASSVINMNVTDEGYMVSGSQEGNDLILTAVNVKDGIPVYYKIRVKDYFDPKLDAELNITNSFIDLSGDFSVGTKSVNLTGTGNDGDILVGPKTIFDEYAMNASDLETSYNVTADELADRLAPWQNSADSVWYGATPQGGTVSLNWNNIKGKTEGNTLDIPANMGAVAFVQYEGSTAIITLASNTGYEPERVVIKVENAPADLKVTMNGQSGGVYSLGSTAAGVTINGEAGIDFLSGYQYGTTISDSSGDAGVKIKYKPSDHPAGESGASTKESLIAEIESATSFAMLDNYQLEVDGWINADEKQEMQDTINEARETLIKDKTTAATTDAELDSLTAEIAKLKSHGAGLATITQLENDIKAKKEELKA
ncbi:MAG: hypothetical protein HYY43_00540 [Deltaproteobacteria bacterium]|nr:hypothetical protein [Deltaproteobacteria bacterium]